MHTGNKLPPVGQWPVQQLCQTCLQGHAKNRMFLRSVWICTCNLLSYHAGSQGLWRHCHTVVLILESTFFLSRLYICSLNIYICQTNHVPTHRRHPTLTQPAPCSLSSLLSWLQSEANLLQGLTSSAQTALQHGWMICLNQAAVINNEGGNCHKTTKQSNDMYWYVCRTITNKVCKCSMTCWSAYLHIQ